MKKKKKLSPKAQRVKDLKSGKGVKDLKNKHHCFCFFWRLHAGETCQVGDDTGWHPSVMKDPGYCSTCQGTGWCY